MTQRLPGASGSEPTAQGHFMELQLGGLHGGVSGLDLGFRVSGLGKIESSSFVLFVWDGV